jgi:hypothetical protein
MPLLRGLVVLFRYKVTMNDPASSSPWLTTVTFTFTMSWTRGGSGETA